MDDSKEFQLMLDRAIENEPLAFKNFDRTKNVQDQLQKMVVDRVDCAPDYDVKLAYMFHGWMIENDGKIFGYGNATYKNPSMEQLWLAFVMHSLRKIWAGTDWEAN